MWKQNRMKDGEEKGRELLGSKWDKIIEALSAQNQDITKYIVEWAYGEIYNRPGLDLKQREIISITSLAMQGKNSQLKTHIFAALNAGLTEEEIMESFIHLALFAGFPTALEAIKIAKEVFDSPSPEDTGVDPKNILNKENA
ncbi:MAG: carboxymuconolactone decarboxylase family protein [Candidatus Cloacimonetes bacterium]|nr:carboxymuconolactone decarboxylase family protein [Candidatus Cloacimonadota bacterium]